MDGWMDRWMDEWIYMDGWMDERTCVPASPTRNMCAFHFISSQYLQQNKNSLVSIPHSTACTTNGVTAKPTNSEKANTLQLRNILMIVTDIGPFGGLYSLI